MTRHLGEVGGEPFVLNGRSGNLFIYRNYITAVVSEREFLLDVAEETLP